MVTNSSTENAGIAPVQLTIALNKKAFMSALFTGPRTFDAYIIRKTSRRIGIQFMDEEYTLNQESVFCLTTKLPDGRKWYSYGGKLNEHSLRIRAQFEQQVRAVAGQLD